MYLCVVCVCDFESQNVYVCECALPYVDSPLHCGLFVLCVAVRLCAGGSVDAAGVDQAVLGHA